MTVRFHGTFGERSSPHANVGSVTTHFGIAPAELRSSFSMSSFDPPILYAKTVSSQRIPPVIAFAYGSRSSFAGLNR
jgi:hypothetical protein